MHRRMMQGLLGLVGTIMIVRFALPALVHGGTGPGPLGDPWLTSGNSATRLLDSDLRFMGAMFLALGVLFFWMINKVERIGPILRIVACGVLLGAAARILGFVLAGSVTQSEIFAVSAEITLPLAAMSFQAMVAREHQAS